MTQFINRNKPEKVVKKVTIFTHCIDECDKSVFIANNTIETFSVIEYLYSRDEVDVFVCTDKDGDCSLYLGKKGDEFED